jgi:hypothetical protein
VIFICRELQPVPAPFAHLGIGWKGPGHHDDMGGVGGAAVRNRTDSTVPANPHRAPWVIRNEKQSFTSLMAAIRQEWTRHKLWLRTQHSRASWSHMVCNKECHDSNKRDWRPKQKPQSAPSKCEEALDEDHTPNDCRDVLECSPIRGDGHQVGDDSDERRKTHLHKKQRLDPEHMESHPHSAFGKEIAPCGPPIHQVPDVWDHCKPFVGGSARPHSEDPPFPDSGPKGKQSRSTALPTRCHTARHLRRKRLGLTI